jgi:predicted phosphodiesterase
MKIALLADIHGNLPALDATMAAMEAEQPDLVVLNGDLINAVPFSPQVIDRVRCQDWLVVRGNHEFYYLNWGTERAAPGSDDPARWGQLHWLIERITPEQGNFLATLPDERTLYVPGTQPLRIAHGVPGRNRVGFYNEQREAKIAAEIHHVEERTLVSAHTHVQIDRLISEAHLVNGEEPSALESDPHAATAHPHHAVAPPRWHLVNPGSVGLPLNRDPRAQFAVLDSVDNVETFGGWRVTHHRVAYDRRPALDAYHETGMLEAGGVISRLFYWELVTAEPEIIYFYRWAFHRDLDPDDAPWDTFRAYITDTGRDQYAAQRDPLLHVER